MYVGRLFSRLAQAAPRRARPAFAALLPAMLALAHVGQRLGRTLSLHSPRGQSR
jgi:hypothetical protein